MSSNCSSLFEPVEHYHFHVEVVTDFSFRRIDSHLDKSDLHYINIPPKVLMMSGTLLHMPIISFPTFMIFSLTLFSYSPNVIFEIKVQDSFLPRHSNSKDLVLFPINET